MPPSSVSDGNAEKSPEVENLKTDISERAEKLVYKRFPENITKLRELIKSDLWKLTDYSKIYSELPEPSQLASTSTKQQNGSHVGNQGDIANGPSAKRPRTSDDVQTPVSITNNRHVVKVSEELKPILREFIDNCSVIKVWISLLVPKMEDGNNFGVSIQAEVVKEVTYYEDDAAKYYEDVIEHFANRAKLCSKVIKYPQIEDYRTAVKECDERQFNYLTKYVTAQLLHSHALLHDLISKNYEKIQRPRGSNSSSLNMY